MLVLGFLLGGDAAQAGYLNYSYHWGISPSPVFSSGTGSVAVALGRGGVGSNRILTEAVTTSSSAPATHPDVFSKSFNLTLHLTDNASHQFGNLTFHGTITGTLSASRANLVEKFSTPVEHITLGGRTYYVELPSSVWLRPPGSALIPAVYANVWTVTPPPHRTAMTAALIHTASVPVGAGAAPEPSALVLAGLGTGVIAALRVWRGRRPFAAAAAQ
jgi:hypothetical protein